MNKIFKEGIYRCNTKCPELDCDKTVHCSKRIESEEDAFNMLNWDCPC